ncbi:MAG TPA: hypothetical protein VD927_19480 [Chryseosolibacter sp.]|nr:hypothetical protein [Chryseosolibacter sp.]
MKSYLYVLIIFFILAVNSEIHAQGCVAVKNMSSCSIDTAATRGFQVSINYRYFKSYKHFRGRHEEVERVQNGTEVINNDNSAIIGVTYTANKKWSASIGIPFVSIDRSSLYEHYGNGLDRNPDQKRFHTQSQGLGDIRLTGYYNAFHTSKMNVAFGLGVKLPTGNYRVKDYFHKRDEEGNDYLEYKVVDQSIQLGDGGVGISTEFNLNYNFTHQFGLYGSGLYLFNPRNTNSVLRSQNLSDGIEKSNHFSVADQFLARLGVVATAHAFQFGAGGRLEGIPSEDLIGKSEGFRRPGYILSIEPSVGYVHYSHRFGLNLPIALLRSRTQNTIDKERTIITGERQNGDAAFADWLVSVSYSYTLNK